MIDFDVFLITFYLLFLFHFILKNFTEYFMADIKISKQGCLSYTLDNDVVYRHDNSCKNDCFDSFVDTQRYLVRDNRLYEIVDVELYCCDVCDKYKLSFDRYQKHVRGRKHITRTTRPLPGYICVTCSASLPDHVAFEEHQKSHVDRLILCHDCNKTYPSEIALLQHMRTLSHQNQGKFAPDNNVYECDQCLVKLVGHLSLQEHKLKRHTDKESYRCEICNKDFNNSESFLQHSFSVAHRLKEASFKT